MSPPLPITEDTPPDMLAGAMDLLVVLPNGQQKKMSVERSTPMMDLLVQITTKNKISPGGHVIQALGDRGILPYKPSTPIGALDTWTVHVVPKKQASNAYYKKTSSSSIKPANISTPFEQTFRLQVNLPRNQLYVSRVSYKTRLQDILREVCLEKNLDQSKYCLVNSENLAEELNLSCTFLECKLQRITLLSKNNRPVGLSSVDIMALKRYENGSQRVNNNYASHSYDGSISSGSLEGRSLSPIRSDGSSCSPTIPKTNGIANGRPIRKRRPAPKPPSNMTNNSMEKKITSEMLTISHSRNSSDSSGYHESSVLSESPESNVNSLPDSLPRRCKLPSANEEPESTATTNLRNGKIGGCLSRSLSNLAVAGDDKKSSKLFFANGIKSKAYSASSMSLASCGGKRKKAPAPPPPSSKSLLSLKEEDAPSNDDRNNETTSYLKSQTLPAAIGLSSIVDDETQSPLNDRLSAVATPDSTTSGSSSNTVDCCRSLDPKPSSSVHTVGNVADDRLSIESASKNNIKEQELTMDDDEIDRIFDDATKGCECPSSSTLSSPADSMINEPTVQDEAEEGGNAYNWQYKLPSPSSEFHHLAAAAANSSIKCDKASDNNAATNTESRRLLIEKTDDDDDDAKIDSFRVRADSGCSSKAEDEDFSSSSASSTLSKNKPDRVEKTTHVGTSSTVTMRERMNNLNYNSNFTSSSSSSNNNDSGLGSDDSIPSITEPSSTKAEPAAAVATAPPIKTKTIQTCRRRGSNLENFSITTYQNTKPTEIFHDDSVKTSKTTQLAKNSRSALVKSDGRRDGDVELSRRGSFKTEKQTSSTTSCSIKRSKSHISVLSGNYARFNKYGKLTTVKKRYDDDDEENRPLADNDCKAKCKSLPFTATTSQLRRSTSEFVINKDTNKEEDELLELRDQVVKWKENQKTTNETNVQVQNTAELQSLQVLKDILPQINKSQTNRESTSTQNPLREASVAVVKSKSKIEPKCELSSVDRVLAVNLQSWNDRPKRQVSIKTDRDYIYGGSKNSGNCTGGRTTTFSEERENRLKIRVDGGVDTVDSVDNEVTRVPPVVRAVEFKKPFVVERTTSVGVQRSNTRNDIVADDAAVKRARPNSCYLFGERPSMVGAMPAYRRQTTTTTDNYEDTSSAAKNRIAFEECHRETMSTSSTSRLSKNVVPKEVFTLRTYNEQMAEREAATKGEENRRRPRQRETGDVCRMDDWHQKRATIAATLEFRGPIPSPPPPPAPPTTSLSNLKPQNRRITTASCSKISTNENARDILLFSIKNFNRDNLKKLRVK